MLKKLFVAALSLFLLVGAAPAASASTHKAASHRVHVKPSSDSWTHVKPDSDSWTRFGPSAESWSHVGPSSDSWTSLRR